MKVISDVRIIRTNRGYTCKARLDGYHHDFGLFTSAKEAEAAVIKAAGVPKPVAKPAKAVSVAVTAPESP